MGCGDVGMLLVMVAHRVATLLPVFRGGPGARQVQQAVLMNPLTDTRQELGGAYETKLLHLFRAETRCSGLGDPHR